MSPRAQGTSSPAVLIPAVLAGVVLLTVFTNSFPAFGLLVRGIMGLFEDGGSKSLSVNGEDGISSERCGSRESSPSRSLR